MFLRVDAAGFHLREWKGGEVMAVKKTELLSVLERYWACVKTLVLTDDDVPDGIINFGIVVSRTEPQKINVMWVKPTD